MKIGTLDLDPRYEYIINTWTLDESALQINYRQMKVSGNVEFLGIYKKLNDSQLLDIMMR